MTGRLWKTFTRQKLHEFKRAGSKLGYPEPEILEKSPDNIPWFAEKVKDLGNYDTKIFIVCENNTHEYPRNKEVYARLSFLGYNITWEEVPHDAATDRIRPIARFPSWRLCNTQLEKAVAIADFMSDDEYQE